MRILCALRVATSLPRRYTWRRIYHMYTEARKQGKGKDRKDPPDADDAEDDLSAWVTKSRDIELKKKLEAKRKAEELARKLAEQDDDFEDVFLDIVDRVHKQFRHKTVHLRGCKSGLRRGAAVPCWCLLPTEARRTEHHAFLEHLVRARRLPRRVRRRSPG